MNFASKYQLSNLYDFNCFNLIFICFFCRAHTYVLHLEVLNTLIVLLSVQMYTKLPTLEIYIYETFMVKMELVKIK